MIPKPLFRKYVFLIFIVFSAILGICAFATQYLMRFQMDLFFQSQAEDLIRQIETHEGDIEGYVRELNEMNVKIHSPMRVQIRKQDDASPLPYGPSIVRTMTVGGQQMIFVLSMGMGPPPPPGILQERGFGGIPRPRGFGPPILPFLALMFAVLLASALSVVLIYRSFRDKADLAEEVLWKMQHGDLKVRFPISRWDEASSDFSSLQQNGG